MLTIDKTDLLIESVNTVDDNKIDVAINPAQPDQITHTLYKVYYTKKDCLYYNIIKFKWRWNPHPN